MTNHAGYVTVVDHFVSIVISVRYFTSNGVSVILFLEFTISLLSWYRNPEHNVKIFSSYSLTQYWVAEYQFAHYWQFLYSANLINNSSQIKIMWLVFNLFTKSSSGFCSGSDFHNTSYMISNSWLLLSSRLIDNLRCFFVYLSLLCYIKK